MSFYKSKKAAKPESRKHGRLSELNKQRLEKKNPSALKTKILPSPTRKTTKVHPKISPRIKNGKQKVAMKHTKTFMKIIKDYQAYYDGKWYLCQYRSKEGSNTIYEMVHLFTGEILDIHDKNKVVKDRL